MTRSLILALALCAGHAPIESAGRPQDSRPASRPAKLAEISWLEGRWTGKAKASGVEVESVYSGSEGGMIVGATKEYRGARLVMFDFEHLRVDRLGRIVMTPFPFGKKSVTFTATTVDRARRLLEVANPKHDFPQKIRYDGGRPGELTITISGKPRGRRIVETYLLRRAPVAAPR